MTPGSQIALPAPGTQLPLMLWNLDRPKNLVAHARRAPRSWDALFVAGHLQADKYEVRFACCQECKHYILCFCFRALARC